MQYFTGWAARAASQHSRLVVSRSAPRFAAPSPRHLKVQQQLCNNCLRPKLPSPRFYSTQPPKTDSTPADEKTEPPSHDQNASQSTSEKHLPSSMEERRSALNQKFSTVMDNLQSRVLTASQTLNDITGYSAIDTIKAENDKMEASLSAAQDRVRSARQAYKTSNTKRAATQREVTTLLARKDTWSPTDLERFTELYRTDHVLEGEVSAAQEALTEAEAEEQSLNQRLNAGILKRYHEEQIWSDRIRRASTWGTWGLMGMNFVLFVLLQFFAEPWRRRRLVKGVVEHEKEVLDGVRGEMQDLKTSLHERIEEAVGRQGLVEEPAAKNDASPRTPSPVGSWGKVLADPSQWQAAAGDLCSDRVIDLRMRDASALVMQGAMAGVALLGGILLLVARG